MASEDGRWDVDDVARGLVEKLVHRHPHVFGDVEVSGSDEVLTNWEKLKAEEGSKPRSAVDEDIPVTLPALARAAKVQRRAAGWGVEWPSTDAAIVALRAESEQLADAPDERAIGAILFTAVAAARKLGVDAETALRRTTRGFAERYEVYLADARERGVDPESITEEELRELFLGARSP